MTGLKSKFFINVGGALIGIVITLATVPLYISHIGESRYGILSLVWIMLGYLGFLDFGLSRATANSLAKMGDAPAKERSGVFMTALFINAALGSLGGLVIYFGGGYILTTTHDLAPALRQEIQSVMPYIGPMLPLALLSGVGIGALEARERFLIANVLQISSNALGADNTVNGRHVDQPVTDGRYSNHTYRTCHICFADTFHRNCQRRIILHWTTRERPGEKPAWLWRLGNSHQSDQPANDINRSVCHRAYDRCAVCCTLLGSYEHRQPPADF